MSTPSHPNAQVDRSDLIDDVFFIQQLKVKSAQSKARVLAFYSSYLGGFSTSQHHAVVSLDEHLVHRGDGVFEAMKFTERGIYLLDAHLERLFVSANYIGLKPRMNKEEVKQLSLKLLSLARSNSSLAARGVMRLYWSRGPGSFAVSPYDVTGPELYAVAQSDAVSAAKLGAPSLKKTVRVMISSYPVKWNFLAQAKTCNYLVNVLMKKEALDRGFDYAVALDESGAVAESSTENIGFIGKSGEVVVPTFDRMLRGTTLSRLLDLAKRSGLTVEQRAIPLEELKTMRAAFMISTTLDVQPVSEIGDQLYSVDDPTLQTLDQLLKRDLETF